MNVSLTPELEKFVAKEVDSGLYQTASEVIRAGLRRLKIEHEAHRKQNFMSHENLEEALLQGVESLDRGEGVEAEAVLKQLRKRIAKRRSRA